MMAGKLTNQDRVWNALHHRLWLLEGPCPYEPRWWQFALRKRDRYVRSVLASAGLPPLTEAGRQRYYAADPQGFEDAGVAWSRKWCAALGLSYEDAFYDYIYPAIPRRERRQ